MNYLHLFHMTSTFFLLLICTSLNILAAQSTPATSENKWKCRQATERLRNLSKNLSKKNSAMHMFVETHYQISSRISELVEKNTFDDNDYVAQFNIELVNQFPLGLYGVWPRHWTEAIEETCKKKEEFINTHICSAAMATAHIEGDFPVIFKQLGCGSEKDWNLILKKAIEPSIKLTVHYIKQSRGLYGHVYGEVLSFFSTLFTKYKRNIQRQRAGCNSIGKVELILEQGIYPGGWDTVLVKYKGKKISVSSNQWKTLDNIKGSAEIWLHVGRGKYEKHIVHAGKRYMIIDAVNDTGGYLNDYGWEVTLKEVQ